ncbi:hypothetical protein [Psychrobacillus sp.]|uniref:hypothetical protein n=1 Tax=Psychrobacillus sp. TaxID=1871623 RepID=UPI0028BE1259|nr:hypothetical protein [Psychrobacillus sp.]
MKSKIWKEIVITVILFTTIVSFSPIAQGQTTSIQRSIDAVKMEMKQAALAYVEPALEGEVMPSSPLYPLLNSVKKNYQATRKLILVSNLSEKAKQEKLQELEVLYEENIVKGLIPYIDAYNYAMKYLEPLLKEAKEAEAKNDFAAVEKAYHKLSVQLKSRTSILYRFTGKAPRDLLLERYKKPAEITRNDLIIPVTIIMKATTAQQLLLAGKKEDVQKAIEEIQALAAQLSSTNPFHQALRKELDRLQAIVLPVLPPSVVPTPPLTGGDGGDNSGPSKSSISTIKVVTVGGVAGTVNVSDAKVYNVELPIGTILANLTAANIVATPTHAKATVTATTIDEGATWQVVVTAENGRSTTTYTINVTVVATPSVKLELGSLGMAGDKRITGLTATTKYVVTEGTKFYGVLANGTLSAGQTIKEEAEKLAKVLIGTEITNLTNGTSYKVEVAANTIAEQFSDPNLAAAIAGWMGKTVEDLITKDKINASLVDTLYQVNISHKGIKKMDGFDIFNGTDLESLELEGNELTSFSLNGLPGLLTLNVIGNQLLDLDISVFPNLIGLGVSDNPLLELDVSGSPSLKWVFAKNTLLYELDVTGLVDLQLLYVSPLTANAITGEEMLPKLVDRDF